MVAASTTYRSAVTAALIVGALLVAMVVVVPPTVRIKVRKRTKCFPFIEPSEAVRISHIRFVWKHRALFIAIH
jgi:hypothetical protein